ncbi:hypothetical protein Dimus_007790 [Dionaea muscipula]
MKDNGLNNVMELIMRQKWENLFKRREFIFVDAVKEFYTRMTVIHLKKKDVMKSSVKRVAIEFDHDKLASTPWKEWNLENGVWWVGTGENRRMGDDDEVPEEEVEEEEKDQTGFDWEVVIDEAAEQGESGSDDQFFYAQVDVEEPMMSLKRLQRVLVPSTSSMRGNNTFRSRPLVSLWSHSRSCDKQDAS